MQTDIPADILQLIADKANLSFVGLVNLATALNISLWLLISQYDRTTTLGDTVFVTHDYFTLISDSVIAHVPIFKLVRPKVGGRVLVYHIKKLHFAILELFDDHCRAYYNVEHMNAAIATGDSEMMNFVFQRWAPTAPRFIMSDVIEKLMEIGEFDLIDTIIAEYGVHQDILISIVGYSTTLMPTVFVAFCDHFNIDMTTVFTTFQYNIIVLRCMIEANMFHGDADNIVERIVDHFENTYSERGLKFDIIMVEWFVGHLTTLRTPDEFCVDVARIFQATSSRSLDVAIMLARICGVSRNIEFTVQNAEAASIMRNMGFKNIKITYAEIDTTIPSFRGLQSLLYAKKFDKAEEMLQHITSKQFSRHDNLFSKANTRIMKIMLEKGFKIDDLQMVVDNRIADKDITSVVFLHNAFPLAVCTFNKFYITRFSRHNMKLLFDAFPQQQRDLDNIMKQFVTDNNIEMCLWMTYNTTAQLHLDETSRCLRFATQEMKDFIVDTLKLELLVNALQEDDGYEEPPYDGWEDEFEMGRDVGNLVVEDVVEEAMITEIVVEMDSSAVQYPQAGFGIWEGDELPEREMLILEQRHIASMRGDT